MSWRLGLLCAVLVSACTTAPAPVVDRSPRPAGTELEADGHYRVKKGDSLYAIAFRFGLDYRDLAVWNSIRSPYTIYPDQLLKMKSTASATTLAKVSRPVESNRPNTPDAASAASSRQPQKTVPPAAQTGKPVQSTPQQVTPQRPAVALPGNLEWQWPVKGRVVRNYLVNDPSRNGLDIAGVDGQAVVSAAGGAVVYSGAGLIGYGELIIIKHNDEFLSAYAHNRKRLVEEGSVVSAGQKIAEMGKNDRNETVLHFEIRVNGRPVDPRKYLPPP